MIRQAVLLAGAPGGVSHADPAPARAFDAVAGRPFVEHVLRHLARFGLREALVVVDDTEVLAGWDGRRISGTTVATVPAPAGEPAFATLARLADRLDDTFLAVAGDDFFGADLARFLTRPLVARSNGRLLLRAVEGGGYAASGIRILKRAAVVAEAGADDGDVPARWLVEARIETEIGVGPHVALGRAADLEATGARLRAALERPAAFLDRDGVINVDTGYTHRIEDLRFTPTAVEGIRRLNRAGHWVIVITNQSGVARGFYSEDDVDRFHAALQEALMREGAHVDAFYHCPYHPEGEIAEYALDHEDRKPGPGMILRALADWPIRREGSFVVGDRGSDLEAAAAAGLPASLMTADVGDLAALVEARLAETPVPPEGAAPAV